MKLNNIYKAALVTGASSGIGAEISKQLCRQGISVVAVSRNRKKLNDVRVSLPKSAQSRFIVTPLDITKKSNIDKLSKLCKQFGHVDLLINNAGIGHSKKFEKLTTDEIERTISTNLLGHIWITQSLLRQRSADQPFHIVFVTSLAGKMGFSDMAVYSASKFALEGLCESLRAEYKNTPVSFTVLRPGITDTNFFKMAGMTDFRYSVEDSKALHSPKVVADKLVKELKSKPSVVTVGKDEYLIKILPFIPFSLRSKALNITNKL